MSIFKTMSPGDVVRTHRAANNWTQARLGEECNLTRATISRIESGDRPNAESARKLANALNCDLELLIPDPPAS